VPIFGNFSCRPSLYFTLDNMFYQELIEVQNPGLYL
jgi:hypothetical protein